MPGIAQPVPAKVSLISPALDPGSTTVEVWLRVENAKGVLKAGTPVHATIQGRTISNALTVPADAIQSSPDGSSKFVMVMAADSTAHKRPVTLGIQNADEVQILSGLTPVGHGHLHRRLWPGREHKGQDRRRRQIPERMPT